MVLISLDGKVLKLIVRNGGGLALDDQLRQRIWLSRKLGIDLLQMVQLNMAVAAHPDEFTNVRIALLREHMEQ